MASAVLARRRAPAVSLGLAAAVVVGVTAFFVGSNNGHRGVPQDVALWASGALAFFGLLGLIFLPGRAPAAPLWRATAVTAICVPLVGVAVRFAVTDACPLYVARGSGHCFYDIDLMGGWAAAVAAAIGLDVLGVAFLVGVSVWQARLVPRDPRSARSASAV